MVRALVGFRLPQHPVPPLQYFQPDGHFLLALLSGCMYQFHTLEFSVARGWILCTPLSSTSSGRRPCGPDSGWGCNWGKRQER